MRAQLRSAELPGRWTAAPPGGQSCWDISELTDAIAGREDLVGFVSSLRNDLLANGAGWENPNLETFLEALAAWCADRTTSLAEPARDQPSWSLVAKVLFAASAYE
jgi:hypothetical protein